MHIIKRKLYMSILGLRGLQVKSKDMCRTVYGASGVSGEASICGTSGVSGESGTCGTSILFGKIYDDFEKKKINVKMRKEFKKSEFDTNGDSEKSNSIDELFKDIIFTQ